MTILAPVTVRCPSNGCSASSTSGLHAPAAQSSAGRAACSYLPWPAVLPRRPHRPYYSHRWPGPAATADESVNPRTVILRSAWETTAESSLASCRSLPRPRRRPPPWRSRRGLVNVVNDQHASEVDCTWRGWQLGPRPHARKCLLIMRKIMIPPLTSGTHRKGLCIS